MPWSIPWSKVHQAILAGYDRHAIRYGKEHVAHHVPSGIHAPSD
jgi:hypothetical protein